MPSSQRRLAFFDRLRLLGERLALVRHALCQLARAELARCGEFTIPELVTLKVRTIPATKASKTKMFGKVVVVKAAKPARKVAMCIPTDTLKERIADDTYVWLKDRIAEDTYA